MLTPQQVEEYRKKYNIAPIPDQKVDTSQQVSPRMQRLQNVIKQSELNKDPRSALVGTDKEPPKQDGFFKSLVKDPIKTLLVKPATRVAQAGVGTYGALTNNMDLVDKSLEDTSVDIPLLGHYDIEGQKAGIEGGKQIVGDALKSASYLYAPGGAEATAGAETVKQAVIQGTKSGAIAGGLYGAGAGTQEGEGSTGDILKGGAEGVALGGLTGGLFGGLGNKIGKFIKPTTNTSEVMEIVRPKLTNAEESLAKTKGQASTEGVFSKVKIAPGKEDIKIAEAASGVVDKSKNAFQNIEALQNAVDDSATKVRSGLKESEAIWNKNELKGKLNGIDIESPEFINVKSDNVLFNKFKNFRSAILKLADKSNKKAEGLLDLRQDFDAIVRKAFPKLYEKDSEMLPIVRAFRETLNNFAASKLPEGKLPTGESIRDEWLRQHYMLKAIENIAEKSPKEGTTAITRWIKNNPTKASVLKYALAGLGIAEGGNIVKNALEN